MSEKVPSASSQIEIVRTWLTDFIAKSNQNLGRAGPVCPVVPPSMEQDKLLLKASEVELTKEELRKMLMEEKTIFLQAMRQSTNSVDAIFAVTVIALENCSDKSHGDLMDAIHASLKIEFMNEGLMIGQFHPYNETPGLHNPSFRPFQCPGYCFAIRNMIPSDHVFISQNLDPTSISKAQAAFSQRFGSIMANQR